MLRKRHKEEGFSMIELMVAIAILSILIVIAVTSYSKHKLKGYSTAVQSDVSNAAIYIAQNSDTFDCPNICSQNDTTNANSGINGFYSSDGVTLTVYKDKDTGSYCIQGEHDKDKSDDQRETTWHIYLKERKLENKACVVNVPDPDK